MTVAHVSARPADGRGEISHVQIHPHSMLFTERRTEARYSIGILLVTSMDLLKSSDIMPRVDSLDVILNRSQESNRIMDEINDLTSDGYHTFGELYEHRMVLTAALFRALDGRRSGISPWRSLLHSDGGLPFGGGWFVVGVTLPGVGQITYHYRMKYWDLFDIPGVLTLTRAEQYDGHSSADVLTRLRRWVGE